MCWLFSCVINFSIKDIFNLFLYKKRKLVKVYLTLSRKTLIIVE